MLIKILFILACISLACGDIINVYSSPSAGQQALDEVTYDYIIVGGGTAGLTIARHLSESPKNRVLVIEAGGSGVDNNLVTIPENSFHFIGTDIDWDYTISPQVHANGQEINLSQGKVLGGDSAVNGLVWINGAKEEYDAFETLGSLNWNWEHLHRCWKKAEKLNVSSPELTAEYGYTVVPSSHGSQGPVQVSFPSYLPIQHTKLVEASIELGHPFNRDPYSGNNTGVYYSLSSQTTKPIPTRQTSEFAYLTPIVNRTNIRVLANATVSKINTKKTDNGVQAQSVEILFSDGTSHEGSVAPSGEVILSAGTVRTPQILELSGIGDSSILGPLGIDVKVNLTGVGANYEDHTIAILTYALKPGYHSFDALSYNATLLQEQTELYETNGTGWLTFAQGVGNMEPASTILTKDEMEEAKRILATKPESIPQDQFDIIKSQVLDGTPQTEFLLFNTFSGGYTKPPNTSYISLAVTHTHPMSRGSIHINSTSIQDHPMIDLNVFESEWDAWFLAKAAAYGRKLFETKAFREIVQDEVFPGNSTTTDSQWLRFVKDTVNAGYHSIGTASLMPKEKNGVVDANLIVYDTANIRVADVSIMPLHVSAHTQTLAYSIGEMAAAIIQGSQC